MTERKEVLKSVIYSVTPRGSIKTNKPSTVEMTVDHRFANKADELYQDIKEGLEPQGKLVRLELVAVWEEDEQVIDLKLMNDGSGDGSQSSIGHGHAGGDYYPETSGTADKLPSHTYDIGDNVVHGTPRTGKPSGENGEIQNGKMQGMTHDSKFTTSGPVGSVSTSDDAIEPMIEDLNEVVVDEE
jgi:hypothetical protein